MTPSIQNDEKPEHRHDPLTCACGCSWIMVNLSRQTWKAPRWIHCPHCASAQPWPETAP